MSLGYDYQKRPSFYQGEANHGESHQGSFVFHITSNFSKKMEVTFESTTALANYKSAWSEASNILKEAINFSVRTTFIPKYTLLAKMNYKYNKQYSTAEEVDNTLLEASISRKIGKHANLSLIGYNLLDSSESKFLNKTAEYVAYTQTSQLGRYLLLSLKFNF